MVPYKNLNGDSGVAAYRLETTQIIVEFRNGTDRFYKYTYDSAGPLTIEEMKRLAEVGRGLNAYIKHHANNSYAARGRYLHEVQ